MENGILKGQRRTVGPQVPDKQQGHPSLVEKRYQGEIYTRRIVTFGWQIRHLNLAVEKYWAVLRVVIPCLHRSWASSLCSELSCLRSVLIPLLIRTDLK
jgi:hypothetical protein